MLGLTHCSRAWFESSGYSPFFHRNLGSILEPPPIVPDRQMAAIVLSHVSIPQPSIDLTPIGESLQRGSDAYGRPELL